MSLRLRSLRLRAETGQGRFGADIPFADGLMVIRADNSRGKSTSVQSILFALGLERMITAKPSHALTSAMRDSLIYDPRTKSETPVLASWVSLEIENHDHRHATLTRWAKNDEIDTGLVRVVHGSDLTLPDRSYPSDDFYVGRPGAAANPRGLHRWLASFIGWEMPELPAADGRLSRLYMEQVFPLLFVEQRRGWGGIQAQMPYFSGVSDVRRRSIEFLLKLDVGKHELERQQLRAQEVDLQEAWRSAVTSFKDSLLGHALTAIRLPASLTLAWPPPHAPSLAQSRGDGWVELDDLEKELRDEYRKLDAQQPPTVQPQAVEVEERLTAALEEADSLRQIGAIMREDMLRDRDELRAVQERLVALREDLRAHQDIVTLQSLGSPELERLHGDCPVCHQQLPESLLDVEPAVRTLSAEDTVAYIRQQIQLFEVMDRDSERALQGKVQRLAALQAHAGEVRTQIRALRTTLTAPNGTPSVEIITRRIRLQERIVALEAVTERFRELLGELERLSAFAREIRAALKSLPADRLSVADRAKLNVLETSFVEQLHSYDFGSFSDDQLTISIEDYLPRRAEFDLQADISASDSIRVIWAYLLGLMETAGGCETNHPGLLVLDEPRQQSTKDVSFTALLQRAAADANHGQVIFATSEELPSLQQMLEDLPHRLHVIDGYVLQRVDE
jgi:hypothetical protein